MHVRPYVKSRLNTRQSVCRCYENWTVLRCSHEKKSEQSSCIRLEFLIPILTLSQCDDVNEKGGAKLERYFKNFVGTGQAT